jgi:hypothetical protein
MAKAPPFYCKGVVVELKREIVQEKGRKEGEGDRLATNLWPTGHACPPLNRYFHPPLHLAPIMLTPLTESIKNKANSFHLFSKFFLIIFEIFILCNDEKTCHGKGVNKKWWMKGEEIKIKYANGGRRAENKI